jgi:hypothetical protein
VATIGLIGAGHIGARCDAGGVMTAVPTIIIVALYLGLGLWSMVAQLVATAVPAVLYLASWRMSRRGAPAPMAPVGS